MLVLLLGAWMAGAEYVWLCKVKNHCEGTPLAAQPQENDWFQRMLGFVVLFFVVLWPVIRGIIETATTRRKESEQPQRRAAGARPRHVPRLSAAPLRAARLPGGGVERRARLPARARYREFAPRGRGRDFAQRGGLRLPPLAATVKEKKELYGQGDALVHRRHLNCAVVALCLGEMKW